ncbi:hypothetical protein B566_EDAN013795 [Ephemera danica]|nr:hypothetical protein B566_EDAN013795 [Ephemera danica]
MDGPDSSYSCLEIHICWNVERDARIEPPIHTEYFLSGYIEEPPERTMLAYRSLRMSKSQRMIELYVVSWIPALSMPRKEGWKRASGQRKRSFPIRGFCEKYRVFLGSDTQFIVECVMPDLLHVIPVRDNAVFDWVFEGKNTTFGLSLVSYITGIGVLNVRFETLFNLAFLSPRQFHLSKKFEILNPRPDFRSDGAAELGNQRQLLLFRVALLNIVVCDDLLL